MTHDEIIAHRQSITDQLFELHIKRQQLETLLHEVQQECEHPVEYREYKSENVYFCGLCNKCVVGEEDV